MAEQRLSKAEREEIDRLIAEFRDETDRAAVVLGAAKLDLQLYQIIEQALLPAPTGHDELLDGDAPLSTFSSRINLVARLGIIAADLARALHLIRKIRNAFAHELSGVSLSSGAHSDRVRQLIAPMVDNWGYSLTLDMFGGADKGSPAEFRAAVVLVMMRLEGVKKAMSPCTHGEGSQGLLPPDPDNAEEASLEDGD